ncbi:MAG: hypothetical protein ACRCWQ_08675 [Bacilli bacterium]
MKFKQVDNSTMVNLENVEAIQKRFAMQRYHIAYMLAGNAEVHEYFETKEDRDKVFRFLIDILCQLDYANQVK